MSDKTEFEAVHYPADGTLDLTMKETYIVKHGQGTFSVKTYTRTTPTNRESYWSEITGTGLQTLTKRDLCEIIAILSRARDRM